MTNHAINFIITIPLKTPASWRNAYTVISTDSALSGRLIIRSMERDIQYHLENIIAPPLCLPSYYPNVYP